MYTDKMEVEQSQTFIENKKNENNEKKRCSGTLRKVGKASIVINVVLLISLVITFFVTQQKLDANVDRNVLTSGQTNYKYPESDMKRGRDMMCIPCEFLGDEVAVNDTLYDVIITTEHDHKMCCLYKEHELQRFIMQMIQQDSNGVFLQTQEDSTDLSEDLKWWRERKSSAHLYHDTKSGKEYFPNWVVDKTRKTSFVNDLAFENNTIHVTREEDNGVYFVYSAVTLDMKSEESLPYGFHRIVKRHKMVTRNGIPIDHPLQMGKYGGSPMTSQWYTSFLCGTVNLQKYEYVQSHVAENSYKYLDRRKYASFFGMYKL